MIYRVHRILDKQSLCQINGNRFPRKQGSLELSMPQTAFSLNTIYTGLSYFLCRTSTLVKLIYISLKMIEPLDSSQSRLTVLPGYLTLHDTYLGDRGERRGPRGRHVSSVLLAAGTPVTLVPRIGDINGALVSEVGAH